MTWDVLKNIDGVLGGKISESLTIAPQENPYLVISDITVMPSVTLTILPGTTLEFAPNVGILVLGSLIARGYTGGEITFKPFHKAPIPHVHNLKSRYSQISYLIMYFVLLITFFVKAYYTVKPCEKC